MALLVLVSKLRSRRTFSTHFQPCISSHCGYPCRSKKILCPPGLPVTPPPGGRPHTGPSGPLWAHLGPTQALRGPTGPQGPSGPHTGPSGRSGSHTCPSGPSGPIWAPHMSSGAPHGSPRAPQGPTRAPQGPTPTQAGQGPSGPIWAPHRPLMGPTGGLRRVGHRRQPASSATIILSGSFWEHLKRKKFNFCFSPSARN